MKEKPSILSDEQFTEWCQTHQKQCNFECGTMGTLLCRLEAQRDADVARCEQAKAEVAREIFSKMMCIRHEGHFGKPYDMWELKPSDYEGFKDKWLKGSGK